MAGGLGVWLLGICLAALPPQETVERLVEGVARGGAELPELAAATLDLEGLTRFALGPSWAAQSKADQVRLVGLFAELITRNALPRAGRFFRDLDYQLAAGAVGSGPARVEMAVDSAREGRIVLTYLLELEGERWQIADVLVDGVSLRLNIRTQVQAILAEEGDEGLLRRLREKIDAPIE